MARLMNMDTGELFRAVTTVYTLVAGSEWPMEYTAAHGPFTTHAQALAAITRETNHQASKLQTDHWWAEQRGRAHYQDILVEGKVQRTDIRWEAP